jgi:hypothetical protein
MARAKRISIGRHVFERQLDALSHFKEMLHRHDLWATVSGEDAQDLAELIKRHKDVAEKVGKGMRAFKIIKDEYKGRCFGIERVDGTIVDFSYIRCVTMRWD